MLNNKTNTDNNIMQFAWEIGHRVPQKHIEKYHVQWINIVVFVSSSLLTVTATTTIYDNNNYKNNSFNNSNKNNKKLTWLLKL